MFDALELAVLALVVLFAAIAADWARDSEPRLRSEAL